MGRPHNSHYEDESDPPDLLKSLKSKNAGLETPGAPPASFSVVLEDVEMEQDFAVVFAVVKRANGGKPSIFISCPVCGKMGRLTVKRRTMYGRCYRILHGSKKDGCTISFALQEHSVVDRVYNRVHDFLVRKHSSGSKERIHRRSRRASLSGSLYTYK